MKSHGIYTIELRDRILYVDATGPFNEDAVKEYQKDLTAYIKKLSQHSWALCAVFRNESLFTPDAEEEMMAVTLWRKKMGMKAVAVIFNDIKGLNILKAQMERIYNTADIHHAFFYDSDFSRAFSWLSKMGYDIDSKIPYP
ncbi:MAG: hypothetical protein GY729_14445 [Desulfobacteraceae bacterium]|nr:hypothetical protein [Desulfobacteraceae bacterium]